MSPGHLKGVLIGLILVDYAWSWIRYLLSTRQQKKPLPTAVKGVYDKEQYARWVSYTGENRRLDMIRTGLVTLVTLGIFAFDLLAWVDRALRVGGIWGSILLLTLFLGLFQLLELPLDHYATFVIEEKYGFNKTTKATFWLDRLKGFLLSLGLDLGLMLAADILQRLMGLWMTVGLFAVLMAVTVVGALFPLKLQRLFYRFTPLPEGELRERLVGLFNLHGYNAKEIYVMNASKRTTRANAFCAGLGRGKKIALFDNLVDYYSEEEITAVFAHELGHAKHGDTLKLVSLQAVTYAAVSLLITWMFNSDIVGPALGLETHHVAGAFIALSAVVLGPVMTLLMTPLHVLSRRFERAADRFAVENGLGDALVEGLTRLHRDSLADLNPHPFLSAIEDSHPTLGERIQGIRKAQGKQK